MTDTSFISAWIATLIGWAGIALFAFLSLITAPLPIRAEVLVLEEKAQNLTIENPWARATPTGARVAAAYFTITSPINDVLLSVTTSAAGRSELHQTTLDTNGSMQMRELAAGIDIPANTAITLAPGGTHVMLMALENPLKEGYEIPLTLNLKHAGKRTVRVNIKPVTYVPGLEK